MFASMKASTTNMRSRSRWPISSNLYPIEGLRKNKLIRHRGLTNSWRNIDTFGNVNTHISTPAGFFTPAVDGQIRKINSKNHKLYNKLDKINDINEGF
jgi:hypothetical protein